MILELFTTVVNSDLDNILDKKVDYTLQKTREVIGISRPGPFQTPFTIFCLHSALPAVPVKPMDSRNNSTIWFKMPF